MAVPGQMNVSAAGAFTYSVPIIVPPGTAGMGPALALDYSSQNGDGPEGIGWALTGMPAITRCPRTVAQDGIHGGVNFDANDRFCMEGQRLVLVAGAYGADGSEYRTEIDSYSRILAHGVAGNGPAWFEVHTKAGQVIELGNTTDSRVLPVKADGSGTMTTARAWVVDKISDTKGNYLTVSYINDTTNGQTYPLSIHYTGNAGASLSPYNSVQFIYGSRPDMTPSYQAGAVTKTTVLLSDIETYAGANLVLDYKLAYRPAGSAATHDELNSITQCDGGATQKCLPPITFAWQGSRDTLTYDLVPQSIAQWTGSGPLTAVVPGDFNGDGLMDVLAPTPNTGVWPPAPCPTPQGGPFFLGSLSGTVFTPTTYQAISHNTSPPTTGPFCPPFGTVGLGGNAQPIDLNGDGITDLFQSGVVVLSDQWAAMAIFNGTSANIYPGIPGILADMDGDGRTDILSTGDESFPGGAFLSNGDGTFRTIAPYWTGGAGVLSVADLDGDGCADIIGSTSLTTMVLEYSCNPAVANYATTAVKFAYKLPNGDAVFQIPVTGDFNGDGKADLLDYTGQLFLSTGTGLVHAGNVPFNALSGGIVLGDFNGDGKTDIATASSDGTQLLFYLSTGSGFALAGSVPISSSDLVSGLTLVPADWNNDGATDLFFLRPSGNEEILFHYTPELMTGVSNGLGASTTVTYGRLNDPTVYTKGSGATYPIRDMIGAQYVVSKIQSSDGIGGLYASNYTYAGAKTDLSGRGFMGFSQVTVTDPLLHVAQTTNYRMDFPFTGEVISQTKVWSPVGKSSVTLRSVTNTYLTDPACVSSTVTGPVYTVELCSSVAQSSDTSGAAFPSVTTNYSYDTFGNVLTSTAQVSDGSSKTTTNTYLNDTTNWFLGRLLTSNVQSVVGSSNLTRHSSYAYDPASGLVIARIVEPQDTGALRLETDTTYDAFGNKHIVTTIGLAATSSGLTSQSRPTTATFDARGQFATTITNALGENEHWSYNGDFGTPATHTGPNNVATSWTYDTFGRPASESRADGTRTLYAYVYCSGVNGGTAVCPTNGAYYADAKPVASDGVTGNGPETKTYYDTLSRVIATDTAAFDSSASAWIRSDTLYDGFGRVAEANRPYFLTGGVPAWTVSSYSDPTDTNHNPDPMARAWTVMAADGSVTQFTYNALTTTVTNANNETTKTLRNAQGLVAQVTDAMAGITTYLYDAFGDMTTVHPPGAVPITVTYTYDLRGRKISAADPDMGTWSYSYDAFGALYQQTDAKSQTSTMAYDALGRLVSRSEPDMASVWAYGTTLSHHNIDKLLTATCTGSACGTGYTRSYLYDALARQTRVTVAVNGLSYYTNTAYDTVTGKISSVRNFSGFTLDYGYTARGYLSAITDDATGLAYWTATTRNAEMQLTQSTAGNTVKTTNSYDPQTGRMLNVCATGNASGSCDGAIANISTTVDSIGNLTDSGDTLHGVSEAFAYDQLNRLTGTALSNGGTPVSRVTAYDSAGSIIEKSDICGALNCFAYAGPQSHAISSIAGTYEGIANPRFFYDANGNMACVTTLTSCDASAAKTVAWTSFNMGSSVKEGSTTVSLLYDPEHGRIEQTAPEGSTYYFNDAASGAMTERVFPTTGSLIWRNYILADGKIVAERWVRGSAVTVRYFTLDHLGSTVVLTKEDGTLAEDDAYDAWGKQRNATTGADDTTCSLPAQDFSNRGYTGHEEMPDGLCLTNMNARIYDPAIGRFLSPDDVIQDVYNGQNYNRYTYVDDNPLSYTDPTGHVCGGCHLDDMTTVDHGTSSHKQNCLGCGGGYDMTDGNDMVRHALAVLLAETGSGPSPSGLPQNGGNTAAGASAAANGSADGGNSPGIGDPMTFSPQAQVAVDIDRSRGSKSIDGSPMTGTDMDSGGVAEAQKAAYKILKQAPEDAIILTTIGGREFLAPPTADFEAIYKYGQSLRGKSILELRAGIRNAIGQGGLFDFQRNGNTFIPAYTTASNYAVGVLMNGIGYSWAQTLVIGSVYAEMYSQHGVTNQQIYMWHSGFEDAGQRAFPTMRLPVPPNRDRA
jgi:RHS repeat-associated protein